MFLFTAISALFLMAAIPKDEANYEGHIAVLITKPSPAILLLKPNSLETRHT
jgi:hypothetical protein